MLRQIKTEDLAIGMFVHKMGGSWFSHPFWKARFAVEDERQLRDIRDSTVPWIMIDTDKGGDLSLSSAPAPAPVASTQPEDQETPPAPEPEDASDTRMAQILGRARDSDATLVIRSRAPSSDRSLGALHQELGQAAKVAHQARQKMRDCYAQARLGRAVEIAGIEPMVDDMISSIHRHPHAFNGIMRLMKTSDYLHTHSLAVSALMVSLATQMRLPSATVREAGLAGLLMDIGMGHVPAEIYDKAGPLNASERTIMHSHTTLAHDFLGIENGIAASVLDVCLNHHERLDGTGYPAGISGDALSLFVRMAAVCDTYDAMTSPRAHRPGAEPASVIEMMRQSTTQFDETVVEAFIRAVGIYPLGSLVRLSSGHLAVVLDQNPKNPMLPRVRTFYSIADRRRIPPETLDLVYQIGREDIVAREDPREWGIMDWDNVSAELFKDAMGISAQ